MLKAYDPLEGGGAGDATQTPAEPRQHGNTTELVEIKQEPILEPALLNDEQLAGLEIPKRESLMGD